MPGLAEEVLCGTREVYERDRKYVVDGSVAELERRLDPRQFIRVRRGVLLNLDYVAEVHGWFAGRVRVRLKDGRGTELVVARPGPGVEGTAGSVIESGPRMTRMRRSDTGSAHDQSTLD